MYLEELNSILITSKGQQFYKTSESISVGHCAMWKRHFFTGMEIKDKYSHGISGQLLALQLLNDCLAMKLYIFCCYYLLINILA